MNNTAVEKIRAQLVSLKSDLQVLDEASRESGETVELDQARVGRLSRMDAMQGQQMALESARRRKQQIIKIEGALRRIESGEYGYCFVCGEELAQDRLAVDPTVTRCMDCVDK